MNNKELHNEFKSLYDLTNEFLTVYSKNVQEKELYIGNQAYRENVINIFKDLVKLKEEFFGMIADDLNNR